jgi:CheY-like chemotaxis protein
MTNSQKKILYIEDDPEARFLMADIIRYKGYIYYEASRGLDGIRMAEENRPDLILVDLAATGIFPNRLMLLSFYLKLKNI